MPLKMTGATRGERSEQAQIGCLWVSHTAEQVTLRQAHAISAVDWYARVTRTACGLLLDHETIENIPSDGALPCGRCLAATAGIVGLESI
ncbi:hypothetical protein SAMN05660874_02833 [Saccharopolyspora flava]|uniref:Uncharacterized protein n=1 Tax=Saccharopolyspora flava TaxID=95161 RepID=A0A1I6S2J8_9PSEU|nr:hypothetical protein SAMN05660874_02833 [Saccharopolyspora flava]